MSLNTLGWNDFFEKQMQDKYNGKNKNMEGIYPGRITGQFRDIYQIGYEHGTMKVKITGKMFDLYQVPVIGDWVLFKHDVYGDIGIIFEILERKSVLKRSVNQSGQSSRKVQVFSQILAANIDIMFIVISLNNNFNLGRIERYLTLAWESGTFPVILLNKSDLCDDTDEKLAHVESIAFGTSVYVVSALHNSGIENISKHLTSGKTGVLVGSSGVGKSTIINTLIGREVVNVYTVRDADGKGRHTTTDRRLIMMPNDGMLIDSPGIREVQIGDDETALDEVFSDIEQLAKQCRFRNCSHTKEPGCAVLEALENGILAEKRLANFCSLARQQKYLKMKEVENINHIDKLKWQQFRRKVNTNIKRSLKEAQKDIQSL